MPGRNAVVLQCRSSALTVQYAAKHCKDPVVHILHNHCYIAMQMDSTLHCTDKRGVMYFKGSIYYVPQEMCIVEVRRNMHFTALEMHFTLVFLLLMYSI